MLSRLNWFETRVSGKVVGAGYTETKWTHYAAYNKKNSTSWVKEKVITIDSKSLGSDTNDQSSTTITQQRYKAWKNKSEKISNKKNQQYYRYKADSKLLNGFMSLVPNTYFTNLSDKYSRTYLCKYGVISSSIASYIPSSRQIPQPDTFQVQYDDFDTIKQDSSYTTGINRSESTGYLVRNRKRTNLRTITVGWSHISHADAKKVIYGISISQWILVNFLDPASNENITKVFAVTSKSIDGGTNSYANLSVTLEEI